MTDLRYETKRAIEILGKAYGHAMVNEKYDLALEITNTLDHLLMKEGIDIVKLHKTQ
jgi:hypothetical protein